MQPVHQKTLNKAVPLDGHLHCWSPLHSTEHRNSQTTTDLSMTSQGLQPLWELRCSLVFSVTPIGHFMYYGMHIKRPSLQMCLITSFVKICFIIIIIKLLRFAKLLLFFLGWSVINLQLDDRGRSVFIFEEENNTFYELCKGFLYI